MSKSTAKIAVARLVFRSCMHKLMKERYPFPVEIRKNSVTATHLDYVYDSLLRQFMCTVTSKSLSYCIRRKGGKPTQTILKAWNEFKPRPLQ